MPGDVVVRGQVLAEILPNGVRSHYRLRLEDTEEILSSAMTGGAAAEGVRVRSLRCEDFPRFLAWQGDAAGKVVGGVLLLERALLRAEDFPSVRKGGRCSVVVGVAEDVGRRGDFVLRFARQVFAGMIDWRGAREGTASMWDLAREIGEKLWVQLDFLRGEKKEVILRNFINEINNARNK